MSKKRKLTVASSYWEKLSDAQQWAFVKLWREEWGKQRILSYLTSARKRFPYPAKIKYVSMDAVRVDGILYHRMVDDDRWVEIIEQPSQ